MEMGQQGRQLDMVFYLTNISSYGALDFCLLCSLKNVSARSCEKKSKALQNWQLSSQQ